MCNHLIKHLFDCELCGEPVSDEFPGYDVENNLCWECKDEADYEAMARFLPYSYINKALGK